MCNVVFKAWPPRVLLRGAGAPCAPTSLPRPACSRLAWGGSFCSVFVFFFLVQVSTGLKVCLCRRRIGSSHSFGAKSSNHCASSQRKPTGCFWASPIRLRHNSNYNLSVVAERLAPIYKYICQSLSRDGGRCSPTGPDCVGGNCGDQE